METPPNIATGIFNGFNDKQGIMICGYEWGAPASDDSVPITGNPEAQVVFSNKVPRYGEEARSWPYDQRILRWFKMWGHELSQTNEGPFEKSLVQTNWCNTQSHHVVGNVRNKLLAEDQRENFLAHVDHFRPRLILFFGSAMIQVLQSECIMQPFTRMMGAETERLHIGTRPFHGRRFKVGFQRFQDCNVISLPHPSGSRGLSDEYISLFTPDIGNRIQAFKDLRQKDWNARG